MIYVISVINVRVNQSPKYPPGEHGRCSERGGPSVISGLLLTQK